MKTITFRKSLLIALAILLFGALSFPSIGLANLEAGLVGYWRFNEGSGGIAYDETYNNNNDGTIRGASWTNGILGDALYFHGGGQFFDGDRVLVPHSSSLDITGELTVTAWIRASGTDNYLAIVDKFLGGESIPSYGFTLYLSGGKLRFSIYSGSDGYHDGCVGTSELRDSCWHHVAGVWDGSYIRVYVDGHQEGEVTWGFPPASTTNNLGIGERVYGWGGYMPFLGVIDEVCIYNRALSDAEIWGRTLDRTVDLTPYFDWGAISSYPGLAPPGFMGIWSPSHNTFFYFPSDTMAPANPPTTPRAWLIPGVHSATFFGPDTVFISNNPIVTVPNRNSKPCSLFVQIPSQNLIDQATDLNVIQISSGESKTIFINDTVETMVFLANCDGAGYCSPDQPLEVWMNYQDGTKDTVVFDNIHPAERANNIASLQYTIYCNEVFGCGPPYYDQVSPPWNYDDAHSEFWHWYTLYPDITKLLNSITFVGIQSGDHSEVYISALSYVLPPEWGETIDNSVDLSSYFDWGAISSYAGLAPPGPWNMGIASFWHSWMGFYFPSDSLAPFTFYPKAWLTPGVHLATNYGPDTVRISSCPVGFSMVTVPDRNNNPCSLFVEVPPQSLIDEATDLNVIQISSGESKTICINGTVKTMVFLASCDGDVDSPDNPSPSQPLKVRLSYKDGTVDNVVFDNIHPAGRLDIIDPTYPPSWLFIYGNEVFVCNPHLYDSTYSDLWHSEAWHWYAMYPDTTKVLDSLTFVGIQMGPHSEVYISALSYSGIFNRGDANGDGVVNGSDVVYLLNYLYRGGPAPCPLEAGDVNCDGVVDGSDVVYLLNYLYRGGPPPCSGKTGGSLANTPRLTVGHAQISLLLNTDRTSTNLPAFAKASPEGFDEVSEISVVGKFDRDVALVHLEIDFNPDKVTLLDPALTSLAKGLQLFAGIKDGTQKIGIVDLSGENFLSAGEGTLVHLRARGEDLTSIKIKKAMLVGRDAVTLNLELSGELKLKEVKDSSPLKRDFQESTPQHFSLSQNYPNPFNPQTSIRYALPQDAQVKLVIYNTIGQKVKTLVDEFQSAGHRTVWWDGRDEKGDKAGSGIYFYRLEADQFSEVKKMLLVK